ncbi:MAG: hypothetical protein WC054_12185 [Candidatus Nanopelagicales bacterium]|jgi:hypothetical protein
MSQLINSADFGARLKNSVFRNIASPQGMMAAAFPINRDKVVYVEDDFIEDTISSTRWNLAADGTATTFAWAVAAGGTIAGSTGTTDNGYFAINGDVMWSGDKNAGMAVRWKSDAVTDFTFEIGFTDALSDETLPAVTDVDTPATGNGATDVAVVHLDTDQTLKTAAFVSESTGTAYAAQKVNLGTWLPTAAVYYTTVVQLVGDNAFTFTLNANGTLVPNTDKGLSLALEGGTLVRPHALFGTRSVAAKAIDVDFVRVWQDRV